MACIYQWKGILCLRYRIHYSDGSSTDRYRVFKIRAEAKNAWPTAEQLEERTKRQDYTRSDIEEWGKKGLLSKQDVERFGCKPESKSLATQECSLLL